ncbi:hypothetical protein EJB05_49191, partial [Eragrostis curvula]
MADAEAARGAAAAAVRLVAVPPPMVDIEAAAVRAAAEAVPPQAPAPAARRTADTVANAVIYCCLGLMWVGNAAAVLVVLARYAVGRTAHAAMVVYVARVLFLGALPVAGLLCLCSVLMLLVRLVRQPPEPPELLMLVEGVYVTAQIHGPERPAARGWRQGGGYFNLVPLLIFVFFWMNVLLVLLLQDRSPSSSCWEDSMTKPALISDMGTGAGSATVMFIFIPYVFTQSQNLETRPGI